MSIVIELPPELEARLAALPDGAEYVRSAIAELVEDLEDVCTIEEEMVEIRAGRSKVYPLSELYAHLNQQAV